MSFEEIWEWFGVVNALIYVYLASKGKRTCFIFGLISSAVFVDILFRKHLYFETIINLYYIVMSVVGWFVWKNQKANIVPHSMKSKILLVVLLVGTVVAFLLGFLMSSFTNASLSYVDSFTTVMAIIATWMMVRKIIENWLIWIVADGVSVAMFVLKDLHAMAILFFIYTILAIYGFLNWKKMIQTS